MAEVPTGNVELRDTRRPCTRTLLSSRALCPGSNDQQAPCVVIEAQQQRMAAPARWIPATSAGMTSVGRLHTVSRRAVLAGIGCVLLVPLSPEEAQATPESMSEAMHEALGPRALQAKAGRIKLEVPELAENGNAVPLRVTVDSPMTPDDHVKSIYVFSERNPVSNVVRFHLSPRAGRATVRTNIRLAGTQRITAVAQMSDGSLWSGAANVVVTQAACIDDT